MARVRPAAGRPGNRRCALGVAAAFADLVLLAFSNGILEGQMPGSEHPRFPPITEIRTGTLPDCDAARLPEFSAQKAAREAHRELTGCEGPRWAVAAEQAAWRAASDVAPAN
jgi:hypothetical protein